MVRSKRWGSVLAVLAVGSAVTVMGTDVPVADAQQPSESSHRIDMPRSYDPVVPGSDFTFGSADSVMDSFEAAGVEAACLGDIKETYPPVEGRLAVRQVTATGACVDASFEMSARFGGRVDMFELLLDTDLDAATGCGGWDQAMVSIYDGFSASPAALFEPTAGCDENWTQVATARTTGFSFDSAGTNVAPRLIWGSGDVIWAVVGTDLTTGEAAASKIYGKFDETRACASVDVTSETDGGYWLAGVDGSVWSFGDVEHQGAACPSGGYPDRGVVDLAPWRHSETGRQSWVALHFDASLTFGDNNDIHTAATRPPEPWTHGATRAVAIMEAPLGDSAFSNDGSYWIVYDNGRVSSFNTSLHFGDTRDLNLNASIIDAVPTDTGQGYWLIGSDGGVFSYGDAGFYGSTGGIPLNQPVIGMAPDPDGEGYWLVASDGGVFAFGAPFVGSIPGILPAGVGLNRPILGMVAYGNGYLLLSDDGGVFNFSDRAFAGSLGSTPPEFPISAVLAPAPTERVCEEVVLPRLSIDSSFRVSADGSRIVDVGPKWPNRFSNFVRVFDRSSDASFRLVEMDGFLSRHLFDMTADGSLLGLSSLTSIGRTTFSPDGVATTVQEPIDQAVPAEGLVTSGPGSTLVAHGATGLAIAEWRSGAWFVEHVVTGNLVGVDLSRDGQVVAYEIQDGSDYTVTVLRRTGPESWTPVMTAAGPSRPDFAPRRLFLNGDGSLVTVAVDGINDIVVSAPARTTWSTSSGSTVPVFGVVLDTSASGAVELYAGTGTGNPVIGSADSGRQVGVGRWWPSDFGTAGRLSGDGSTAVIATSDSLFVFTGEMRSLRCR